MNTKFNKCDERMCNQLKELGLAYRKASLHRKKLERRIRNISQLSYNPTESFSESINRLIQDYYKDSMSEAIKRGLKARKLRLNNEL